MKQKREVWIDDSNPVVFFVKFLKRKKYQHYSAAQFDKKLYNKEYVELWIKNQNYLILVKDIK